MLVPTALGQATELNYRDESCHKSGPVTKGLPVYNPDAGKWWVLHTRARHEKAIAATLAKHQIDYYLPLVHTTSTRARRAHSSEIPLFPGYLFLHGQTRACEIARKTNRVANILAVDNQQQLQDELQSIYRIVESGVPVDLYPALRAGRRCRIIAGSLQGIEGVVLRRKSISRVYVSATFVGQSAVIEVDSADVEPVD
jgi:transcriptional antiterminator RfaH